MPFLKKRLGSKEKKKKRLYGVALSPLFKSSLSLCQREKNRASAVSAGKYVIAKIGGKQSMREGAK